MRFILVIGLVLLVGAPASAKEDAAVVERRRLQEALYSGNADTILSVLQPDPLAAVATEAEQLLRLMRFATDAIPRFDLKSGKAADWNQIHDRLVQAVGGLRDWKKDGRPRGNRLLVWAKEEAAVFRSFLDERRGALEEKLAFTAPIREISKSEPGGMWSIHCYLRAFELNLRVLHHADSNAWGALGQFVYMKAKMDQRQHLFSSYMIPVGDACRPYGEAVLALTGEKPSLKVARDKIEEAKRLIGPFVTDERSPEAAIRRYNDLVDLTVRYPALEMEGKYKSRAIGQLKESSVPDVEHLKEVLAISLPLSSRWRTFEGLRGGKPALHVWQLSPAGVLEREFTFSTYDMAATHRIRGTTKPVKGSDTKGLCKALSKAAAKEFKGAKATSPKKGTYKGDVRWRCEIKGKGIKGYGFAGKAKGRSFAVEVIERGDLGTELPRDVAQLLMSITPAK